MTARSHYNKVLQMAPSKLISCLHYEDHCEKACAIEFLLLLGCRSVVSAISKVRAVWSFM